MLSSAANELKETNNNQVQLNDNKADIEKLNRRLEIEEKLAKRKAAKQDDASKTNTEKLQQLKNRAEKEGKLIQIHRESDKVEHKLSLEEKIRARKRARASSSSGNSSNSASSKPPMGIALFRKFTKKPNIDKSELYKNHNTDLFTDLEEAAVDFVKSNKIPRTWDNLLKEVFCIEKLTELEKARVIFHYITAQNLKNLENLGLLHEKGPREEYDLTKPEEALAGVNYGKITYSTLYSYLCTSVGLICKVVDGKVKGSNWQGPATDLETCDNSWNVVTIDGQKRLIDCHWGSRHISHSESQGQNSEQETGPKYAYEEFYFMPDPDQLLSTHFPNDSKYQLVKKNISVDNFKKSAKVWPLFYKLDCTLVSDTNMDVMASEKDGRLCCQIEVNIGDDYRNFSQLIHNMSCHSSGDILNNHILHYRNASNGADIFKVNLPKAGKYRLEILGFCPIFLEGSFDSLVAYQITAPNLTVSPCKNPLILWSSLDMIKTYGGYTVECFRHNLEPYSIDCFEPILSGKPKQNFRLTFKILEKDENTCKQRTFRQAIYSHVGQHDNNGSLVKKCVKRTREGSDLVNFDVSIPENNEFESRSDIMALVLFTDEPKKNENDDRRFVSVFAHFLLKVLEK